MAYEPRPDSVPFRALAHMELLFKGSEIVTGLLAGAIKADVNGFATQMQPAVDARLIFRRQKGGHLRSPVFWSLVDHSKDSHIAPAPGPQTALSTRAPDRATAADRMAAIDGIDIDQAHRTRDNVVEMEASDTPKGSDSQHVLKAEPNGCTPPADATDRETPAIASLGVGPTGARQAADAAASRCDHGMPIDGECPACRDDVTVGRFIEELGNEIGAQVFTGSPPLPRIRAGTAPARWGVFSDGELHIEKAGARIVLDRVEFESLVAFLDRMGGES